MMAELPLSVVAEGIDCRLRVGVDAESLEALAQILLGFEGASNEMLADIVREMANVAGGAMVTAADAEGVALAIGVPTTGDPVRDWSEASGTVQEFALGVTGTAIEFSIRISAHSRELLELTSADLLPGMVVARTVATHDGVELATAGLRLTEATVETIAELLPPTTKVVVLAASGLVRA
jgi:chemotaxis protein CheY-P-specific phosphatase CheC